MKQRREFIRSVALAATFIAARPALNALGHGSHAGGVSDSGLPDCATFERLRGTKFRVSGAATGDQWLELDQVVRMSRGDRVQSFSLRFRGSAHATLPERMYRFSHPECERFDFFINPGSTEGNECKYRAIICRLI